MPLLASAPPVCSIAILAMATSAWAQNARSQAPSPTRPAGRCQECVVELRAGDSAPRVAQTDASGHYVFESAAPGSVQVSFGLANFASVRRDLAVPASGAVAADATLHLMFSADVTVTGKRTFTNLADAIDPATNLIGIAQSASQGAITGRQLDTRPMMRTGEVLETVPGVVISQHSGEGKANQYYLRGFNLDHGTDFSTTVAGMPVNMPSHGHGHGYSDLNFLIPELVSGVQFSKGPYFAEQGDFTTAGSANINYANALERPLVRLGGGGLGFGRVLAAASPGRRRRAAPWRASNCSTATGRGIGPTTSRRSTACCATARAMASTASRSRRWGTAARGTRPTRFPARAVASGAIGRFGDIDPTDGGESSRYSAAFEWQRARGAAATKVTAYGLAYDLDLFSNFTYFLDDPVNGDQFQQADRRVVSGAKISHRRMATWAGRAVQNSVGVQLRHDDISRVGLYHTIGRQRLETVREDAVVQTSLGAFAQNETEWTPWLRSADGASRRRLPVWRRGRRAGQQRHGVRLAREPEGRRGPGAVEGHRDLRERRARIPQQRRAGRDDHGRSHHRRSLPSESRRWRAPPAPRSASARCA